MTSENFQLQLLQVHTRKKEVKMSHNYQPLKTNRDFFKAWLADECIQHHFNYKVPAS